MSGLTSGNGAQIEATEPSSNGEPVFRAKLNNDSFVFFSFFFNINLYWCNFLILVVSMTVVRSV